MAHMWKWHIVLCHMTLVFHQLMFSWYEMAFRLHRVVSSWEDVPTNNKDTKGLSTSRPISNIVCLMTIMQYEFCDISFTCRYFLKRLNSAEVACCLFDTRASAIIMMKYSGYSMSGVPQHYTIVAQRQYWNRRYRIIPIDFDELSFWHFSLCQQCA